MREHRVDHLPEFVAVDCRAVLEVPDVEHAQVDSAVGATGRHGLQQRLCVAIVSGASEHGEYAHFFVVGPTIAFTSGGFMIAPAAVWCNAC